MKTKYVIFISLVICLILEFFHPIYAIDQDLGRHLALGNIILKTFHIPMTNLFSYTNPTFPFINSHWLTEAIFAAIVQTVGFEGLLISTTCIAVVTFWILFFPYAKKHSSLALGIASLLSVGIIFDRTDIRPELFSFLFLAIFLTLLFKNKQTPTKLIFLLPLIEILWVNIHIYFLIGILVIGLFLTDSIIAWQIRKTASSKSVSLLGAVFVLSFLASCINPHGITGALYPFFVFQNYGYSVEENQSIFFLQQFLNDPAIYFFEGSSILLGLLLLMHWKKVTFLEWALFGAFTYLGITAIRNTGLYVFASFGLTVTYIDKFGVALSTLPFIAARKKTFQTGLILGLIFATLWTVQNFLSIKSFGFAINPQAKNAVRFFQTNHLHGPIFNNFDIGSYLIYTLYPKEKVFVDGRPEAYPAAFFQNLYIPMQQNPSVFETTTNKYHFNTIFFGYHDQTPWAQTFLARIFHNSTWHLVYMDGEMVIFVRNIPANQPIMQQFAPSDSNFSLETALPHADTKSLVQFAYFLENIGWKQTEEKALQQALIQNHAFCPALYQLGKLYFEESRMSLASIYAYRLRALCQ